ncbi:GNAT family N-acetyltransferase [Hyphococcus luteus]|uniref:GNAT family N-acetyltransferase n=1 Tax=Hyphococcus luteus TaxID=2058213 RepID=A0A2S7K4Q6_9PROT|nr:GNAT family N-acetyltransferase [Marinicaulis flavus]PQA87456.1 GNAT family N-acetyltransferase [Marinicaulis flavus]
MSPERPALRAAGMDDAGAAADILAAAFAADPVMSWTFGGNSAFRTIFHELARGVYLKHGFGHIADGGVGGGRAATLWLPAGAALSLPPLNELRIALASVRHGGFGAVARALKIAGVLEKHHPQEPHYYLFAVGVTPGAQGQGLGGALLREGLKRADEEGAIAYLENSNPKNTPLYERLGFRVTAPLPLPAGAPPLLSMRRAPQGASS